ncbi:MAG: HD domain-containing protein, partial [Micromonosporaceae bacterium]
TLRRMAEVAPPLPNPWPPRALHALLGLLGAGSGLVAAWEACDRYGLVQRWLPEWQRVRSLPQRNPVHLYTVDRHLVQAASKAAELTREVARPDLLLLGTLLHDIGKGLPGDHSQAGAPIAQQVCRRLGLTTSDTELVCRLVRHHLLLADTATRRDLADPATIELVAGVVEDSATLDLLYALTRADAAGAGPLAWTDWKGRLVTELVRRTHRLLDTGEVPPPEPPEHALVDLAAGPLPAVRVRFGAARDATPPGPGGSADTVAVVADDRRGLLAAVAGVLAVHRLDVYSANTLTIGDTAVLECAVRPQYGTPPDPELLTTELRRAVAGQFPLAERVGARERAHRGSAVAAPRVVWLHEAASHGTVLELRAADSPGLLYRVAHALEETGAAVRAARICTLGADVVDSFYLTGEYADPAARAAVESAVLAACTAPPART